MIDLAARLDQMMQDALLTVAPAISLTVYHQDELLLSSAWGWLNPEDKQLPTTIETLFDLASITKLFTTTALLVLISKNDISLQTPLHQFIPDFIEKSPRRIEPQQNPHTREYETQPSDLIGQTVNPQQVTLWHLLTHTAGLAPWRDLYHHVTYLTIAATDVHQRWQQILPLLFDAPFVDFIGKNVRYSDLGLLLLGEVVSRIHGHSLDDAIQKVVLAVLPQTSLTFNPLHNDKFPLEQIAPTEYDRTWRQQRVRGTVHDENAASAGGIAGHAGLFGSAADIALFGVKWLQQAFAFPATLYDQATTEQACTGEERRGLGWMLRSRTNSSAGDLMSINAYGHTGFTGTSLWIEPTQRLVVALMTNRVYYGRDGTAIHALRQQVHNTIMEAIF
jgi:serine-type D-Ala-D-Ala carboxypeptidase